MVTIEVNFMLRVVMMLVVVVVKMLGRQLEVIAGPSVLFLNCEIL